MTTIRFRVRTTARKLTLKVRPGVRVTLAKPTRVALAKPTRVALAKPTIPGKTRPTQIRQVTRVQKDHD
jgi:hypothetical protein